DPTGRGQVPPHPWQARALRPFGRTAPAHPQRGQVHFALRTTKSVESPEEKRVSSGGRLQDQVAWISGAASGIGEGVARLFAREGAAVALVDVQAAKGLAAADQIRAQGGRAIFVESDVGQETGVRTSIEQTVREF